MSDKGLSSWQVYAASIAACVGLSAGLWFTLVQPEMADRAHHAQLRNELTNQQGKATELATTLGVNRAQLASLRGNLSQSSVQLEPSERINQRLSAINELATESSLSFGEIRPGTPAEAAHFKALPIHVSGSGSYPACTAFLHHLRKSFPDIGVASFEAAAGQPAGIAFKLELIWYTRK